MVKNNDFSLSFGRLGESSILEKDAINSIEECVCAMYNVPKIKVNEAIFYMFSKLYAPHHLEQSLGINKCSDPCYIPPCRATMLQKQERTNYVAYMEECEIVTTS